MKIKFTEMEKINLQQEALKELIRLEAIMEDKNTIELIDSFKNKFNLCESVYKVILREHQKYKGNNIVYLKITMKQVPHAMRFAGYNVDHDLLSRLFSFKDKKGERSAKKLRDLVTHSIEQSAIDEIKDRQKELFNDMNCFLNIIRNKILK